MEANINFKLLPIPLVYFPVNLMFQTGSKMESMYKERSLERNQLEGVRSSLVGLELVQLRG